jgi:hypothetical protein
MENKDYERERNAFIPTAEKCANKKFKKPTQGEDRLKYEKELDVYNIRWNKCFHQEMNRLWTERNAV